jgi:hypothetical protein
MKTKLARTAARLDTASMTVLSDRILQLASSVVSAVTLVTWPVIALSDRRALTGVIMMPAPTGNQVAAMLLTVKWRFVFSLLPLLTFADQ